VYYIQEYHIQESHTKVSHKSRWAYRMKESRMREYRKSGFHMLVKDTSSWFRVLDTCNQCMERDN